MAYRVCKPEKYTHFSLNVNVDCYRSLVIIPPCFEERSHSWSSARDWKSRFGKPIVGSNPTLSARVGLQDRDGRQGLSLRWLCASGERQVARSNRHSFMAISAVTACKVASTRYDPRPCFPEEPEAETPKDNIHHKKTAIRYIFVTNHPPSAYG